MIVLGIVLLVLSLLFPVPLLHTLGLILIIIGVILFAFGHFSGPVGGRRYWY